MSNGFSLEEKPEKPQRKTIVVFYSTCDSTVYYFLVVQKIMFDNVNFDLDDDRVLGNSFAAIISSTTQKCSLQKRRSEEIDNENLKRLKPSNDQFFDCRKRDSFVTAPNKFIEISAVSSKAIKRKFPGPAGLLPERAKGDNPTSNVFSFEGRKIDDPQDHLLLCSQRTVSVFEDGPWKEMTQDFYVPNGECPYNKYNISWIKTQASIKKLLVNHKAPFLAAVIQSMEIFDHKVPVINVILKDSTGEIQGTVLHSLYEEYSNLFTIGSVLVLKQFGVLSTGYNNHCLTITPNNLVTIYCLEVSKNPPNARDMTASGAHRCNMITKVVIQNCCIADIIKKYQDDVSAKNQKEKSINFGKIYHNHGLLRSSDNEGIRHMLHSTKLQDENSKTQKVNSLTPLLKNSFIRTNNSVNNINSGLPLENLSKVISHDASKKKFTFKRTECLANVTDVQKSDGSAVNNIGNIAETNHIVSNGQSKNVLSVRPDNKEHTEIWKNILEGVDTDSLFEDF